MPLSSLSAYLKRRKRLELATVLQIIGCSYWGLIIYGYLGTVGAAFTGLTFWEQVFSSPYFTLDFFSFCGFCVIAVGLLILVSRRNKT